MSPEIEVILSNKRKLRNSLMSILQEEMVNYILTLIAYDEAHRNFLNITKDN